MKPLPAQPAASSKVAHEIMPSLPSDLNVNQRRSAASCATHRAYPWLLGVSTAIAGAFCLLYITKPVISAASNVPSLSLPNTTSAAANVIATAGKPSHAEASLLPSSQALPGETGPSHTPRAALTSALAKNPFEESNLRIQHILTAEAPGGHLARIDVEVPVLYQSRNLRWTQTEAADARNLLLRLTNFQEKSQALRAEAAELLDSWNQLINHSIPQAELRADSPTLPINQQDAAEISPATGLNSTEAIQIQAPGK
jgi:hypothetical protein